MPYTMSLIEMRGIPDKTVVRDFLNRLTTVDTKSMQPGSGQPGAWLSGQGKIRAFFYLWYLGQDRFLFELAQGRDRVWTQALLSAIDQMTFGESYTLTELPHHCEWSFEEAGSSATLSVTEHADTLILNHGSGDFGRSWVTTWSSQRPVSPYPVSMEQLHAWRIDQMSPWPGFEIQPEATLLHEVRLEDRAVARGKGCYPGQEVVERIFTYGAPAKRLCKLRFHGSVSSAPSAALQDPTSGADVGTITTPPQNASGGLALGIVKKLSAVKGGRFKSQETEVEIVE